MSILDTLGHGISLLIELSRPKADQRSVVSETGEQIRSDRLPDSSTLAGIPLRILLSDRSGPGGLLKETLMTRPSTRD